LAVFQKNCSSRNSGRISHTWIEGKKRVVVGNSKGKFKEESVDS